MRLDDFLSRLSGVRRSGNKAQARCPAHDDKNPSLGVTEGNDGRILVKCHARCTAEAIVAAMNLTMKDLMPEREQQSRREVDVFDYHDEKGALAFQVVRFEPKDFRQRRPDGQGGWVWSMKGVRPTPYRLPELIAAPRNELVFVVEGERKVDLLVAQGYVATCNPGGAGMGWRDSYSEHFEGRLVCVLEDNDEAGKKHAKKIKESLERYRAQRVEVLSLPGLPEHGDVVNWFRSPENTKAKLDDLVRIAFTWDSLDQEIEKEEVDADQEELDHREVWSFSALVKNRAIKEPEGFLYGELFARGTVSLIMGANSAGKSYFIMYLGEQIALGRPVHGMPTRPGRVLFLSEEMGRPDLRYRGGVVWDDETRAAFGESRFNVIDHSYFDFYAKGKTLRENKSVNEFVAICKRAGDPDVVFLDSLGRIHSAAENDNQQMLIVMRNLEFAARLANVALVIIHHFGKQNEFRTGSARGRGASSIVDAAHDVLSVDCLSIDKKESLISFEKTRALIGKPAPQPFVFSQVPDPSGRVFEKADGEKIQGVVFTIGDYQKVEEKLDRETRDARDCFEQFVERDPRPEGVNELGEADRATIVELFSSSFSWGKKKADRAISRCLSKGMFESRREKNYHIIFLPRN